MKVTDYLYKKDQNVPVWVVALAAAIVIIIFAALIFIFFGSDAPTDAEEVKRYDNSGEIIELPEWIKEAHLPVNEFSRPGKKTDDIVGIVVHYVGNPNTSAEANRNYFAGLAKSGTTYASSNFIIGLDGEIIECVPLGEVAYCSNNRNSDTVSIECCHPDKSGKFTEETYRSLVKLCQWLSDVYGLKKEDIIRHHDVTGKLCPLYFVEHGDEWEAFKDEVFAN